MELMALAQSHDSEEKRYVREGFTSDEELSVYDLLFSDNLNKDDIKTIKKVAVDLLAKIKEKISDWNTWQQVGAKAVYDKATDTFSSEGMYMLPYTVTISGLIFDYDSFVEKGLLTKAENTDAVKAELTAQGISYHVSGRDLVFDSSTSASNYASGETIMRAGKDGKYGHDGSEPFA